MDIINNDIDKIEITSVKQWTTEAIINEMEERRKVKTTNAKEYKGLNNHPRKETDRAKEVRVYMEGI